MTSRPSTAAPILAVLAGVLVILGTYVGGYLASGTRGAFLEETVITFPSLWQARLFHPAMYVEEKLTGKTIRAGCDMPRGSVTWSIE